jgi:hypothetical protein
MPAADPISEKYRPSIRMAVIFSVSIFFPTFLLLDSFETDRHRASGLLGLGLGRDSATTTESNLN